MSTKLSKSYSQLIRELKNQIKTSKIKAHLAVNRELLLLYFQIGNAILEKEIKEGWGTKITQRIADDLREEFPEMTGLSYTNIRYMKRFAEIIRTEIAGKMSSFSICQAVLGKLDEALISKLRRLPFFNVTWYHNIALMDQISDKKERIWYANKIIENGWSRNVLVHQIELNLYERQAKKITKISNFSLTLPKKQSELANSLLKDPYNFEFLGISEKSKEKNIEKALVENIRNFLLELGKGFAFVGQQFHLEVGNEDFYIDLLFYHIKLRRYVVIELKTTEFKPEYAGKLNFYIAAINKKIKEKTDRPTIGILLCKTKSNVITEFALENIKSPIGISQYQLTNKLSKELQKSLPTAEEFKKKLKDRCLL